MRYTHISRVRQRGISLVEMSFAIAVVAALLIGGFFALKKVQTDRHLDQARREMPATVTAISISTVSQPSTQNINTQVMSMFNAWPKERVSNPGLTTVKVNGPFPSSTEVVFGFPTAVGTRLPSAFSGFNYWISNIPQEACLPLLQILVAQRSVVDLNVGRGRAPGAGTRAGNTSLVTTAANGSQSLNLTAATTACAVAGTGILSISALIAREG
jgi:hypothetical protein